MSSASCCNGTTLSLSLYLCWHKIVHTLIGQGGRNGWRVASFLFLSRSHCSTPSFQAKFLNFIVDDRLGLGTVWYSPILAFVTMAVVRFLYDAKWGAVGSLCCGPPMGQGDFSIFVSLSAGLLCADGRYGYTFINIGCTFDSAFGYLALHQLVVRVWYWPWGFVRLCRRSSLRFDWSSCPFAAARCKWPLDVKKVLAAWGVVCTVSSVYYRRLGNAVTLCNCRIRQIQRLSTHLLIF